MKKLREKFEGIKAEYKKIIWPSRETAFKRTGVVLASAVALGCMITIVDYVFQTGINFVIGLF